MLFTSIRVISPTFHSIISVNIFPYFRIYTVLTNCLFVIIKLIPFRHRQTHASLRSFIKSTMSMCGRQLLPVRSEHSALCKFLAAWLRDVMMQAASDVSFTPREHRSTSLTSPSIFRERMVGNTQLKRSSTLFLKAESRHTRFSMKTPFQVGKEKEEGGRR